MRGTSGPALCGNRGSQACWWEKGIGQDQAAGKFLAVAACIMGGKGSGIGGIDGGGIRAGEDGGGGEWRVSVNPALKCVSCGALSPSAHGRPILPSTSRIPRFHAP